jgi:hypothetical protein
MPTDGVTFDKDETEALRAIVRDWIGAKFVSQPFSIQIASILSKLEIESGEAMTDRVPVTQEHISERALIRPK